MQQDAGLDKNKPDNLLLFPSEIFLRQRGKRYALIAAVLSVLKSVRYLVAPVLPRLKKCFANPASPAPIKWLRPRQ